MNRDDILAFHPIEAYLERTGVRLYKKNGSYLCRCPLGGHVDTHPSFTVKDGRWTCWTHPGGRTHGTIIDLVMAVEKLTCGEAMRKLSGK